MAKLNAMRGAGGYAARPCRFFAAPTETGTHWPSAPSERTGDEPVHRPVLQTEEPHGRKGIEHSEGL